MLRFENVATPFTAFTVNVPLKVADGEPGPREIVTAFVAPATTPPLMSCTATVTAGDIVTPAVAADGDCAKASFVAGRLLTVNAELVRSEERRVGKEWRSRGSPYH